MLSERLAVTVVELVKATLQSLLSPPLKAHLVLVVSTADIVAVSLVSGFDMVIAPLVINLTPLNKLVASVIFNSLYTSHKWHH